MKNHRTHTLVGTLGLLAIAMNTIGCGGSSVSNLTGTGTIQITWPEATRVIPVASNSITVSFLSGSSVVASQTVARPSSGNSSTVTFQGLPAGSLTLKAQAFPNSDGTGVAQASATKSVAIVADTTNSLSITMASTISSLSLIPTSVAIVVNTTSQLGVSALDSNGATVLISDSTLTYQSSNTSVATVSSTGLVTGVSAGNTTISVTESESGVTASVSVTISPKTGGATVGVN